MTGPDTSKLIYLAIRGGIIAWLGSFGIRNLINLMRLQGGTTCTGTIKAKRIERDEGTFYYATYAFRDARGRTHEREIELRKDAYARLSEHQSVGIVYQPNNPENSYLAEAGFRRSHLLTICITLLIAAVLGTVAYTFVEYCVILNQCPAED